MLCSRYDAGEYVELGSARLPDLPGVMLTKAESNRFEMPYESAKKLATSLSAADGEIVVE